MYIYEVRGASPPPPPTCLCTLRVFHYYENDVANDAKPFLGWRGSALARLFKQARVRVHTNARTWAMSLCARAIASI